MKNILLTVTLAVIAFGCKKDDKACYRCVQHTYFSWQPDTVDTSILCDRTEDDINSYKAKYNRTLTQGSNTTTLVTICAKQ